MQKKQMKGFTLIELLAVIVILAIIALIAVPVIMNVITKARISAFEDSAYGIVKAGELYYSNQLLDPEGMTEDQEFTVVDGVFKNEKGEILEISGSIPSNGKVIITSEGKVALAISNGEYYLQKSTTESSVKAKSLKEDSITEAVLTYKKVVNPIFTTSPISSDIPSCITNNTECSAGTYVAIKVNDTTTLDFQVVSDDTENNKITLLFNQGMSMSAWITKDDYLLAGGTEEEWGEYGNNNKGPLTALKSLEQGTSNWTNIPLQTYTLTDDNTTPMYSPMTRTARARMITYTEAINFGCTGDLGSCPLWMVANGSHWTSTSSSNNAAWSVNETISESKRVGFVSNYNIDNSNRVTVRPVITISKSVL